jgi:hypothetical protein
MPFKKPERNTPEYRQMMRESGQRQASARGQIVWEAEMIADVLLRREAGQTLKNIAASYGVTWQRIRQITIRYRRIANAT